MNIKKILALFGIVLVIVVLGIVIVTRKKDVRDDVDEKVLAKIAQEVWDEKPNENGQKLICIWRTKVKSSDIDDEFFKRYSFKIDDYDNEENYQNKIVPMITQQIMEKYGDVDLENDIEMSYTINAEIEMALSEDMDEFIRKKRKVTSDLYDVSLEEFIKRNSIDNSLIQYKGSFTGTIIMYATDEQIIKYAKDEDVLEISTWEDTIEDNGDDDIIPQETYQEDKDNEPKINFDAQYIHTGGSGHEDVVIKVIHSVDELSTYYEKNKDIYDLERREKVYEDDTIGFLDACDIYDEEYFKEQVLVLVLFDETSSSIRHEIKDVYWSGSDGEKQCKIVIDREVGGFGDLAIAEWHILVELEKGIEIKDASQIELEIGEVEIAGYEE